MGTELLRNTSAINDLGWIVVSWFLFHDKIVLVKRELYLFCR